MTDTTETHLMTEDRQSVRKMEWETMEKPMLQDLPTFTGNGEGGKWTTFVKVFERHIKRYTRLAKDDWLFYLEKCLDEGTKQIVLRAPHGFYGIEPDYDKLVADLM